MSDTPKTPQNTTASWERLNLRPENQTPYLRIFFQTIFVRDQDRSVRFFKEQLGFSLVADYRFESGQRWVAVTPPDGNAFLTLVAPMPDTEEYALIGKAKQIAFITEDVALVYQEWLQRGVHFLHPPETPVWGGLFTSFEDIDGNSFVLVGFDRLNQAIEAERRQYAEKLEFERRTAQELAIAKQVQAKLFPQTKTLLQTLDYDGTCIQARQVGGDYYDFLNLGGDKLGLVIGDVAGKGIAAALMMANLQANVRSQCAIATENPQGFLQSVNRHFCENTTENAYATFFYSEYDDQTRRLRYANCGHLSGLLLRREGALERLNSTSLVLGLFEQWDCSFRECQLYPGDILVLYTDGVTETFNSAGEEFGEARLIEVLRQHCAATLPDLLAAVVDEVQQFSPQPQQDDITLVLARGK